MRSALRRRRGAQDAVERVARDDQGARREPVQFGDRTDLLAEDPFGLARFERDQVRRLVVVDDVHEGEFGTAVPRQQARPPQGPLRAGREVRRCEDVHGFVSCRFEWLGAFAHTVQR